MTVETELDPAIRAFAAEWGGPYREDVPVFGCCRHAVNIVLTCSAIRNVAELSAADRVKWITGFVNDTSFDQASTHACCQRHLIDLAIDLPAALALA